MWIPSVQGNLFRQKCLCQSKKNPNFCSQTLRIMKTMQKNFPLVLLCFVCNMRHCTTSWKGGHGHGNLVSDIVSAISYIPKYGSPNSIYVLQRSGLFLVHLLWLWCYYASDKARYSIKSTEKCSNVLRSKSVSWYPYPYFWTISLFLIICPIIIFF